MLSARGLEMAVLLLGLVGSSAAVDDFHHGIMGSSSETVSGTLLLVLAGLLAALRLL